MKRTDSEESVTIEAFCIEFCEKLEKFGYFWYTDIPHFDTEKLGKLSEDGRTLHINENVLEPGKKYLIVFGVRGTFLQYKFIK